MRSLTIAFILIGLIVNADAQVNNANPTNFPNPSFLNHIYYYQSDSLVSLEKIGAQMKTKTKALGFGGGEAGYSMDGEKSQVRIKAGEPNRFVIKMAMTSIDPSMMIKLYKFDSRKGSREAIISSQAGPYSRGKGNENTLGIAYNIQKSGNDLYVILPASTLKPGEYGFLNMMMINGSGRDINYTVFAFGID